MSEADLKKLLGYINSGDTDKAKGMILAALNKAKGKGKEYPAPKKEAQKPKQKYEYGYTYTSPKVLSGLKKAIATLKKGDAKAALAGLEALLKELE